MDSTAQTAPRDSDIINETSATGGAWIRQRKQPKGLRHHQRKCCHGSRIASTAQTAPMDSEIINKNSATGDAWLRQRKQT